MIPQAFILGYLTKTAEHYRPGPLASAAMISVANPVVVPALAGLGTAVGGITGATIGGFQGYNRFPAGVSRKERAKQAIKEAIPKALLGGGIGLAGGLATGAGVMGVGAALWLKALGSAIADVGKVQPQPEK